MNDSNKNTGTLKTDLGDLRFTMTDAGHVYIDTNQVTVNRVVYNLSCHFHLIDGKWGQRDYRELYMSRPGSFDDVTNAARKKALAVLLAAWTAFVESSDFATVALAAERGHLQAEIEKADEEIVEANEKLLGAQSRRAALRKKLAGL